MKLSKSLAAVAGLVTEGASVADVGTDHGYIPIYLTERGVASKVLALDVNKGPLERARIHIASCGLNEQIETRLSDGLRNISPGEADTMIAAGMGGGLVIKILEEGKEVVQTLSEFILQPQSEIDRVRRYLNEHGMCIAAEDMVCEDGKYYPVMKAVHGKSEIYEEWEYMYGKKMLLAKHPVLKEYLIREMRISREILQKLEEQKKTDRTVERIGEIKHKLECVGKALSCYGEEEERCYAEKS